MDYESLISTWYAEEAASFTGWDFSRLNGRWDSAGPHWDYKETVRKFLDKTHKLLDMGTGGGEVLLTLEHPYGLTYVTEAYPPNVVLCERALSPLGIVVKQVFNDSSMPFDDDFFDIILNRHESFDMNEVRRILKPGGIFITQQVGSENDREFIEALSPGAAMPFPHHTLHNNIEIIRDHGFEILLHDDSITKSRLLDVGAVIYYVKAVPWAFPNFSVERRLTELLGLQRRLEEKGYIENTEHRFIIAGRKR